MSYTGYEDIRVEAPIKRALPELRDITTWHTSELKPDVQATLGVPHTAQGSGVSPEPCLPPREPLPRARARAFHELDGSLF